MQTKPGRDRQYLDNLVEFVNCEFGLGITGINPAARGFYGETWRLDEDGGSYFAKLDYHDDHQIKYQRSFAVMDYLADCGVDFISKIVKPLNGGLCGTFDGAVLGVFEWIDGQNIETDATKAAEYQMLCEIYSHTKPGFHIPAAEFSDYEARRVYRQWKILDSMPKNEITRAALDLLVNYKNILSRHAAQLSKISQLSTSHDFYFTHGDAGGNFVVGGDKNYLVDWDEAMYAPIERDAWVMCCYDWARDLFNETLAKNGIAYELQPLRLAYYCYHMFFHYLGEFLDDVINNSEIKGLRGYLGEEWIFQRLEFAEGIYDNF